MKCLFKLPGFPRLLESPGFFFVKFPGPGKSWKMDLVLESTGNFSGKSWNFLLGYNAGGKHNGVGVGAAVYNANSCDKFSDNLFAISQ